METQETETLTDFHSRLKNENQNLANSLVQLENMCHSLYGYDNPLYSKKEEAKEETLDLNLEVKKRQDFFNDFINSLKAFEFLNQRLSKVVEILQEHL